MYPTSEAQMLEPHHQIDPRTRRRYFQGLVEACGEYGILPSSYIIPESKVRKLGDSPVSSGGFSGVWEGVYGEEGEAVAIKVLRRRATLDVHGVARVGSFDLFSSHNQALTILRNFCREAVTWKHLSHPNILPFIGVTANNEEYAMISPWMRGRTIVHYLRNNSATNPLKLARTIFHFVHLSVKPLSPITVRGCRVRSSVSPHHGSCPR